jgi:rhodanese-related sulfurtransferase
MRVLALLAGFLSVATGAGAANAGPSTIPTLQASSREAILKSPYCGVYCMYAVLRMYGMEIPLQGLIVPKYVGSLDGSSVRELQRAAREHGLQAMPMGNITTTTLRSSRYPILLLLRGYASNGWTYNHWVLYLGMRQGYARIWDVSFSSPQLQTFESLAVDWTGTGLVVSKDPIDTGSLLLADRIHLTIAVILVILSLIVVHLGSQRLRLNIMLKLGRHWIKDCLLQTGILIMVSIVLSLGYHAFAADGFIRRMDLVKSVRQAHAADFMPTFTAKELDSMMAHGVTVIDARYPPDYEAGHIRGAVNIPINSDFDRINGLLPGVNRDNPIVVYCKNVTCPFSKTVASMLASKGFAHVGLFVGGWEEWEQYEAETGKWKQ